MNKPINPSRRASAFTVIELLVVMSIIVVLVGSVIVAGSTLITKSKITTTRATLIVVRDTVEQFAREQRAKPTLTRRKEYSDRFGFFPPDELEWFSIANPLMSVPISLAPGGAEIVPSADTFVGTGVFRGMSTGSSDAPPQAFEHRDLAAMILAIELFGQESKDMLGRIAGRNRTAGAVEAKAGGMPVQFLDRNGDGAWDVDDVQIRYIVDAWDTPIGYMAQRDYDPAGPPATASANHPDWNEVSTKLIRLNNDQPLIFSYGPDGQEQLTKGAMGSAADASIPTDFGDPASPNKLDHTYNADNVYVNETLKETIRLKE